MGYHLIFRRTKGGIINENPKGGITEIFGRIQRGTTQICLDMKTWDGGIAKVVNCYLGGSLQRSNIQSGDRLNFTLFSPKPPPPALNNDRSLKRESITAGLLVLVKYL